MSVKQYIKKTLSVFPIGGSQFDWNTAKKLGSGTYGNVYRVVKEYVAIKEIDTKPNTPKHNQIVKSIQNETNIMRRLDHPNIVKLFDAFQRENDARYVYIVMELCTGGELFDALQSRYIHNDYNRFSEDTIRQITKQVLNAVQYCHSKRIAHLDIKPENIILATPVKEGQPFPNIKLIDFGLAMNFEDFNHCPCGFRGTLAYAAPEILQSIPDRKARYNQKADIWSIGIVLYVLFIGGWPFENPENIESDLNDGLYFEGIPELAKQFILRLLTFKPNGRPSATTALKDTWVIEDSGVGTIPTRTIMLTQRLTRQNAF